MISIPIEVASAARSFSKLRLIKNNLRSTMSQKRLSSLSMISIKNDIVKKFENMKACCIDLE